LLRADPGIAERAHEVYDLLVHPSSMGKEGGERISMAKGEETN